MYKITYSCWDNSDFFSIDIALNLIIYTTSTLYKMYSFILFNLALLIVLIQRLLCTRLLKRRFSASFVLTLLSSLSEFCISCLFHPFLLPQVPFQHSSRCLNPSHLLRCQKIPSSLNYGNCRIADLPTNQSNITLIMMEHV